MQMNLTGRLLIEQFDILWTRFIDTWLRGWRWIEILIWLGVTPMSSPAVSVERKLQKFSASHTAIVVAFATEIFTLCRISPSPSARWLSYCLNKKKLVGATSRGSSADYESPSSHRASVTMRRDPAHSTVYTSFTPETLPSFKSCKPCGTPARPFRTSTGCVLIFPELIKSSDTFQNFTPNS